MLQNAGLNRRIADLLLEAGKIKSDGHRRAVEHASRTRLRLEEAVVELGVLPEVELLRFLATMHRTRYVSTEKLARAAVDPAALARVSKRTAELYAVFPVLLDEATLTLTVATADPDNAAALHDVKLAGDLRGVLAIVARPAAVRAAIAKHYGRDASAFSELLAIGAPVAPPASALDELMAAASELGSAPGHSPPSPRAQHRPAPIADPATSRGAVLPTLELEAPAPSPTRAPAPSQQPRPMGRLELRSEPRDLRDSRVDRAELAGRAPSSDPPDRQSSLPLPSSPERPSLLPAPNGAPAQHAVTMPAYTETLGVLVGLLEQSRGEMRGHSGIVARLVRKACDRMGLPASRGAAYAAAAYLHDLGKMEGAHLTALSVAEFEAHRVMAAKLAAIPAKLMEPAGLPPEVVAAIESMYERYDGTGLPQGLAGKDIPLGARLLAIADAYADLLHHPGNPFGRLLGNAEASVALAKHRGLVFDPNLLDLFAQAVVGDDVRQRLLTTRHRVLLVDPDAEETSVLELRLVEQGFDVVIARTRAQAEAEMRREAVDLVVSEVDLESDGAGIALRETVVRGPSPRPIWVILARRTDRALAAQAYDLGVDDFVAKPAMADLLVAKLQKLLDRRSGKSGATRGVSGSLAEMSLPDVVQILWHGRKTCGVRIDARAAGIGEILFDSGQVVHAQFAGEQGQEAFYRLLALREGVFRLDPNAQPSIRTISASPEALLLEGMRRLDEAAAAAK